MENVTPFFNKLLKDLGRRGVYIISKNGLGQELYVSSGLPESLRNEAALQMPIIYDEKSGRYFYRITMKSDDDLSNTIVFDVTRDFLDYISLKEKVHDLEKTIEDLKIAPISYFSNTLAIFDHVVPIYDEKKICNPISFEINKNDRIALIGKNGSGKSSLLKLLLGQPINHQGTINLGSGIIISYVPQDTSSLKGNLTEFAKNNEIDESLFKAILRKMDFSRIQFEKNIEDYSAGQKKKVLIAKSLCEKAHLYVWDEPLNYIDIYSRMQIEKLIQEYQFTMIFVEHDKTFTNNIATKKIEL